MGMRVQIIFFCSFLLSGPTHAQLDTLKKTITEGAALVVTGTNLRISEPGSDKTYTIHITVTNIRNRQGTLRFKFYDDTTPFPDLNGFLKVVVPKTEMKGDSLTLTVHGFVSRYMAIALLDDENNDVKLDMGWFLPKEGHAFSDYYHAALRRPVYQDFRFLLTGDKKVVMRMKYY